MTFEALAKQGQTTIYSSLAASIGPRIREIRKEMIKESFLTFSFSEHRLEPVAVIRGMKFINDSKSSNLNATWFALEQTPRPVIWIVGGVETVNDYDGLRQLVRTKVKAIICIGDETPRLHKAFGSLGMPMIDATSMEDAVEAAYSLGDHGDAVLLSPACPSFDLFKNYEERGEAFRKAVKNL